DARPWDEEFLLAALLHDVGKAIDPHDHVVAGLEALDGLISDRTAWLIEHHMHAHAIQDRTIGHRVQRRLVEHPDYDDLLLLGECDRAGRKRGVAVPTVEEAMNLAIFTG
ncbi:MAG: HD domain-containing protein, partial [Planctomycetota bacterium]